MTTRKPTIADNVDVRDVLRLYGWKCGPQFEHRYLTDAWVFNLVNIIERQEVALRQLRAEVEKR